MARNKFIYGSIIMVIVNIFIRIIGFSYEVILSKFLGAEGMGLFQIGTTTLMVFLSFTTAGIPTTVTKLVSEEESKKNYNNVNKIYNTAMIFNLCISTILSIIIVFFAEFIAVNIFKTSDMIHGVYLLAPAIIIISLTNVLKSYFYGLKDIITPSKAQIIESTSRFIIIVAMLYYFSPKNPIHGALIAILGISIGEFCDLVWSLIAKERTTKNLEKYHSSNPFSIGILGKILLIAFPLTISGFFSIILRFINNIMIPARLVASGYSNKEALAIFGRVTGMAMPLIYLPFMVTSAIVVNLIPSLSEHMMLKRYGNVQYNIQLAIKATSLISTPLMAIFIMLSKPLAIFLYNDPNVGEYIRILGYGTILLSLEHTFSGILFGIGKQVSTTSHRLFAMTLQVVLLYLLVGNSKYRIYGFFISFFITNLLILILDYRSLKKAINLKLDYFDIFFKPLIASLFMVGYIQMSTYNIENLHQVSPIIFIFTLIVAFLAYILMLMVTNTIPKDFFKKIIGSNR